MPTTISEAEFHRYLRVQESGRVNMGDEEAVAVLAPLDQEKVREIKRNYAALLKRYPNVAGG
jgi:hypothetical protein